MSVFDKYDQSRNMGEENINESDRDHSDQVSNATDGTVCADIHQNMDRLNIHKNTEIYKNINIYKNTSGNTNTNNVSFTFSDRLSRLPDTRVLQKNLVYIIGIPSKYSCPLVLGSDEFFGRFGSIRKIVVKNYERVEKQPISECNSRGYYNTFNIPIHNIDSNLNSHNTGLKTAAYTGTNIFCNKSTICNNEPSTIGDGSTGLSRHTNSTVSCYITYYSVHSAIRCISCLDESLFDNRPIRVTFGTTKYCSFFLKNKQCNNEECMYLHTIEDNEVVQSKGKFKLHTFKPENKGRNVLGKERIDLTQLFRYKDIGYI